MPSTTHPPSSTATGEPQRKSCWGCFRQRRCWVPTWRGWLALLLVAALVSVAALRTVHTFLSPTSPLPAQALVAEGWMPDYAAKAVLSEFNRGNYSALYVTGGPLELGAPLSEYKTYAQLGAAILEKLGMTTNKLQAVPAPEVRKDRTYVSALALKEWLEAHGGVPPSLNVISVGPHARRTRLLFERAFGRQTQIGIIAVEDPNYDPRHWWSFSRGFRVVVDESVAYLYARFLFRPEKG